MQKCQLHCFWCHYSHFCCHPWQDSLVLKLECSPCLLMFEIWVPTRNPDQADQPCILEIPAINYHKNSKSHTDLHQHIVFTYLLQPTTTIPSVQKNSCQHFGPQQDSKQERATRLTPTRAIAPQHVNYDRIGLLGESIVVDTWGQLIWKIDQHEVENDTIAQKRKDSHAEDVLADCSLKERQENW